MGCNTSTERPKNNGIPDLTMINAEGKVISISTVEKNLSPASKVIDIAPKVKENLYAGITIGMPILCLDIFHSKYTGERMARWRAAMIRDFHLESLQVHIHFNGWKDKHDIILHLPDDLGRLAPTEILNDQEKLEGQLLNEIQYHATEIYLKTGFLEYKDPVLQHEEVLEPLPDYYPGQLIDVQDIYKPKNKPNVIYKWRPGEVKAVNGPHIDIHYVGWGEEWDETIDISVESKRIRPAGSQLLRRSPVKNHEPKSHSRDNLVKRQSTREEESILYNERRKSSSNVEEQRRGSFTRTASFTSATATGSGGSTGSRRDSDLNGTRVRHRIAVKSLSREAIPESELLTDSDKSSKRKLQRKQSNSARKFEDDNYPPRQELNRNHSDPGSGLTLPRDEDDAIPSEIDESEYYETLKMETAFFEAMNRQGFHIVEMDGDGNCLFRSVAHQIYLDEDRHHELRLECVQHLEKHADRFGSFYPGNFKEYLRNMKKSGVWGDDLEIKALEEMTDRLIHIYSSHSDVIEPLITNFDEKELMKEVQPIILSYHGKNHYNSVYDENTSLPLERRSSQTLLNIRCKSYRKK